MAMTVQQQQSLSLAQARAAADQNASPAPAAQPTAGSLTSQGLSGVNEGIANAAGFPVDAVNSALGGIFGLVNKVAGTNLQTSPEPALGSQFWKNVLSSPVPGTDARPIVPRDNVPADQFARTVGQGVGSMAVMGPASGVGVLPSLAAGVGSGVGSATAGALTNDNPLAVAGGGIVGGGLVAGIDGAVRGGSADVAVPTADQLRTTAGNGYDAARGMGVDYSSDAIAKVAAAAQAKMEADGIIAPLAPKTFSVLKQLTSPPAGSVAPFTGVEAARRAASHVGRDFTNPTDQLASRHLVDAIDQFVASPAPGDVVAGPAGDAGATVEGARGNYAAAKRSDTLQGIGDAAEGRAAASNSGLNADNAIRGRVESLLQNPKQLAGFSPDEVALLQKVAHGTPTRNALRFVSNLLGGGAGLGASVVGGMAGEATGRPWLVSLPAAGVGARLVANALTKRALATADTAVRTRSPLYEQWAANPPQVPMSNEARAGVARALLAQGTQTASTPRSR